MHYMGNTQMSCKLCNSSYLKSIVVNQGNRERKKRVKAEMVYM